MKLDMLGIVVENIQKSLKFYRLLGLELTGEYHEHYVELNSESIRISLNSKSMITDFYGFEPQGNGHEIEVAFACESKKTIDDLCHLVASQGYPVFKAPVVAFLGQYYAVLKDPDSNLLSLFANLD